MRLIRFVVLVAGLIVLIISAPAKAEASTDSNVAPASNRTDSILAAVITAIIAGIIPVIGVCASVHGRIKTLESRTTSHEKTLDTLSQTVNDLDHVCAELRPQMKHHEETLDGLRLLANKVEEKLMDVETAVRIHGMPVAPFRGPDSPMKQHYTRDELKAIVAEFFVDLQKKVLAQERQQHTRAELEAIVAELFMKLQKKALVRERRHHTRAELETIVAECYAKLQKEDVAQERQQHTRAELEAIVAEYFVKLQKQAFAQEQPQR